MNATSVLLEPLEPARKASSCWATSSGETELAEEARARILEAAEGNPLFVEEMLEMLIDDGLLERRNGSWVATADLTDLAVRSIDPRPPRGPARPPLRRGARGDGAGGGRGKDLPPRGGRRALPRSRCAPRSPAHLLSLVRKELVRPDQPDFADEDAFRFRHLLIRDTAYESLPKAERAELHQRFADWLERKAETAPPSTRRSSATTSSRPTGTEAELGIDRCGPRARAAERLASAGRRAETSKRSPRGRRQPLRSGSGHASRGRHEAAADFPRRSARVLLETGELARAESVLSEAMDEARRRRRRPQRSTRARH